ncbi:hypothetical protein PWT90_11230 [Aphanocladium album]|nr:hypothetical protein PWT90_11230 [Aphanocladium album]
MRVGGDGSVAGPWATARWSIEVLTDTVVSAEEAARAKKGSPESSGRVQELSVTFFWENAGGGFDAMRLLRDLFKGGAPDYDQVWDQAVCSENSTPWCCYPPEEVTKDCGWQKLECEDEYAAKGGKVAADLSLHDRYWKEVLEAGREAGYWLEEEDEERHVRVWTVDGDVAIGRWRKQEKLGVE